MNLHCIEDRRCGGGESAASGTQASILLSKRQQEILAAACHGTSDKVIAGNLGLSPRTLEGHWRAIHRKLGSENRCQAGFLFAALPETVRRKILS